MRITRATLRRLHAKMKEPFETSFGLEADKDVVIVELESNSGAIGFAECVAGLEPLYSEETVNTAWQMIENFFLPQLFKLEFHNSTDLDQVGVALAPFKGNRMAKAAVEMAVWDLYANETDQPLHLLLGGTKAEVDVGISVGIQADVGATLRKIDGYLEQGFQRIKLKVKPGWDVELLRSVRESFPDIALMADANSAYRLSDIDHLRRFDEFGLTMIEQPLAHDDIIDHAELQRQLQTPICLDESIHSAEDARKAIKLQACRVINLKLGRVGGFAEAVKIHDLCRNQGMDLWCGGMLETGIGRLHNIAITSLPGFNLPGDTAPSSRYFHTDLIEPSVTFGRPGKLTVESLSGVAGRVNRQRLEQWTVTQADFSAQ